MANSKEARTKTTSKANAIAPVEKTAPGNKAPKATHSPKGSRRLARLTFGLAAIALIAAFYASYVNLTLQQNLKQQVLNLEQLKQQQAASKNDFTASTEQSSQSQAQLQTQMEALTKNLQTTLHQQAYQKQDWLLLKARYYLELAHINAHWSQDADTTIALLQQADTLLTAIPDQQLFAVRQAIAKDIAALQALPKVDRVGLLSQLDAAQELVGSLPLKLPLNSSPSTEKNPQTSWQNQLKRNMNLLKNLIVIRRNDNNFATLLSPLSHTLLCESIQLNLRQAQWAILQNNPGIYQITLAQAIKDIQKGFDENTAATQSLLKQLETLQQVKIEAPNPILDESLPLLNQIIAAISQPIASAPSEGEEAK